MWLLELPLMAFAGLFTVYLALVAAAAMAARPQRQAPGLRRHRFAVVIPAHNEAATLPSLLAALERLDYPRSAYEVVVVADNCEDDTAALAAAGPSRRSSPSRVTTPS
jgi:cellulose synthase/poly-beta-1,6-N-acetylglucosamine synthase-like glycosyltransferase